MFTSQYYDSGAIYRNRITKICKTICKKFVKKKQSASKLFFFQNNEKLDDVITLDCRVFSRFFGKNQNIWKELFRVIKTIFFVIVFHDYKLKVITSPLQNIYVSYIIWKENEYQIPGYLMWNVQFLRWKTHSCWKHGVEWMTHILRISECCIF